MFDARIIANYVLDRADRRGREVTNLDLQKIVYFLHGHYLFEKGQPLVKDEFEAWPYGPVHRAVYDAFRGYNDTAIDGRATAFDPIRRQRRELPPLTNSDALQIISKVVDRYLDMPTYLLVQLTHANGTPWSQTVAAAEQELNIGMKIPNSVIATFFEDVTTKAVVDA